MPIRFAGSPPTTPLKNAAEHLRYSPIVRVKREPLTAHGGIVVHRSTSKTVRPLPRQVNGFTEIKSNPNSIMIGEHEDTQNLPLRAVADLKPDLRVLDVGCGDGHLVRHLRRLGLNAEGVDTEPSRLLKGTDHFIQKPFEKTTLPPESYDRIYSNCAVFAYPLQESETVALRRDSLRKISELLKPGGHARLGSVRDFEQLQTLIREEKLPLTVTDVIDKEFPASDFHPYVQLTKTGGLPTSLSASVLDRLA